MPLVSVYMQAWNAERFIGEAIESVLRQDFKDLELIIVDDGSTDATRLIIERYTQRDPRVRGIFHARNLGISRGANDGIEAAQGKFIAHIDADDVWVSDKLSKQLAVLQQDEDLIVWSEGEIIDAEGRPAGQSFSEYLTDNIYVSAKARKSGYLWLELLPSNYIFHSTIICKKQNLGAVRYDERLLMLSDFKFVLDLARNFCFCYISEPLAKYRMHGENLLASSGPAAQKRQQISDKEYISIVEGTMQEYHDEIPRGTRAVVYGHIGLLYCLTGETKTGLRYFFWAFFYNPLEKRNLWYLRLALGRLLRALNSQAG